MSKIQFRETSKVELEWIRQHGKHHYNYAEISDILGVSRSSVWRWHTDNPKYAGFPTLDNAIRIHDLYQSEHEQQTFVPLRWKWTQNDGSSSTQDLQIPIEVWKAGVRGADGIADYVTTAFARDWAKDKEEPVLAEQSYYNYHIYGFGDALEKSIREAYAIKKAMRA